jgi:hypothetical protein
VFTPTAYPAYSKIALANLARSEALLAKRAH